MEEAVIYSTYKLSDEEIKKILDKFPNLKNFKIKNIVDKSLIAGIMIVYSDKIIDLSFKNRLKVISQKLYEQL